MNDKDKEAFEKHINVVCNKENDYERFYAIWQAACEYKQQEIDELKTVTYWSVEQDGKVTRHISVADVQKLQAENAKLRECVEFYANKAHWGIAKPSDSVSIDPCDHYDPYATETSISNANIGGKRARQCLKELEEK